MVEIKTRSRILIWRTFGRIPWHVIPEPPATLQGTATWRIQCHDHRATSHIAGCCHQANSTACHPRATYHIAGCCQLVNSLSWFQSHMAHCRCSHLVKSVSWSCHIAGCKNSIRHIENSFSPYLFFKCRLGFDEPRLSYRLRYTCFSRVNRTINYFNRGVLTHIFIALLFSAFIDDLRLFSTGFCRTLI